MPMANNWLFRFYKPSVDPSIPHASDAPNVDVVSMEYHSHWMERERSVYPISYLHSNRFYSLFMDAHLN